MTRGLVTTTLDDLDLRPYALRLTIRATKLRARRYLENPMSLEAISLGLSIAHPRRALAVLDHLEEAFWRTPRRHFGFGGEVPLINIKGARLWARMVRRFGPRMEAA